MRKRKILRIANKTLIHLMTSFEAQSSNNDPKGRAVNHRICSLRYPNQIGFLAKQSTAHTNIPPGTWQ